MGYTRKKLCSHAGCNLLCLPNSAYCEKHIKIDQKRNSTSKYQAFYHTNRWRKERKDFLCKQENIWCKKCLEQGEHKLADTVHHKFGFNSYESFFKKEYWVAWCSSCHSSYHTKITNEELYNKNKDKWQ